MPHTVYESPLASRNASPQMLALFSPRTRVRMWRRFWLELARAQRELGLDRITQEAIDDMADKLDAIDFARAAELEKRFRHDVMAHVHAFEEAAPAAKGIVHLGATSQFVVDNTDLCLMRDAMRMIAERLANIVDALCDFAVEWKDLPTLSYTHFQPAQLTTVGKRAVMWAQDFAIDLDEIEHRMATLKFRGVKGTTGTQASHLALFGGDHDKCDRLDEIICRKFGFEKSFAVSGQTYPRKIDAQILAALAGCATSVHRFCNDVRLLAGLKQIEEPFESEQVGSSAMAYKRNPMRCERATGLARFVISMVQNPLMTASEQWFERTLDDSSNRRLSIPESFLALDGCLVLVLNVARGLVVYPKTIEAAIGAELPFMASEEILMAAVQAGGDRQQLHERLRTHSQAAAEQVKLHGKANDLIDRLRGDSAFAQIDFSHLLDARRFIGRSVLQVDRFIAQIAEPIRNRYRESLGQNTMLRV